MKMEEEKQFQFFHRSVEQNLRHRGRSPYNPVEAGSFSVPPSYGAPPYNPDITR
jgi:hypothetical protein